jgi:DNA-binding beta-propeller fold protein YncE
MRTSDYEIYVIGRGMLRKLFDGQLPSLPPTPWKKPLVAPSVAPSVKPSVKPSVRPRLAQNWNSPAAFYTPIAEIGVSSYPALIALNPDNRYAWVTHGLPMFVSGSTVDQIDISTNTVLGSIAVGSEPTGVAVTSDNSTVCVISQAAEISVIDISSSTDFGPFPTTPITYPTDIAASSTNSMWITSFAEGEPIIEFDISGSASTVKTTIAPPVTTTLTGVAVGPVVGGNYSVWVCDSSFNQVYQIDASSATIIHTIPLSYRPLYVAVSPDNSFVWITHPNDEFISQINVVTRAVTTINVPGGCISIKVSPDSAYVWVTNFYGEGGAMIQIDVAAATVVNYISYNNFMIAPIGLAIDPSNTSFWIPDVYNNVVERFPIKTVPLFTVNGGSVLNYGEVEVTVSLVEGQAIDLSSFISVGGGATLSYSIYNGDGSLVGSLLTVTASGTVQIEVDSSQVEDPQSSGGILVTLTITVSPPPPPPPPCDSGLVLPNLVAQLSGSERISIRSAVTIYNGKNTDGNRRFKNTGDYIAYKKASMLAYAAALSVNGRPVRPPPTSALLNTVHPPGCSALGGGGGL